MDSMRWAPLVAVVALLGPGLAAAQDKTDFTGTWTVVDQAPSANASHVERIVQGADHVIVQTDKKGSAGALGYAAWGEHTYAIGGPIETTKDARGRTRSLAIAWEGPRLVFVRLTTEGANTTIERETWSLRDDGLFLTKEECTADWQGTRKSETVFRRTEGVTTLVRPRHDSR